MAMNWGAFAGGAADGYRKQSEDLRKQSEEKRKQEEAEREDAYRKEIEGIVSPDDAHKGKVAEYEKAKKQAEIESSSAATAAKVVANPVAAQGIRLPASTFAEDTAQRVESNPLAPSGPATSPSSVIAANGLGAANAMRQEVAKPEPAVSPDAPKAPGLNDWLEFATKRAAIDVKHGKMNGLGMMQLAQARKQLMDEGVDEAVMKFQQGDFAGGLETFNASGKYVGAKLVGEPQRGEFDYNGVKMPTTIVTMQLPDGRTETINTAQYGTARIKAENQFSALMNLAKHKDDKAHQSATLKETSDHNRAMEGIARTKAAEGAEATTAEIRNIEYLVKNGIVKDRAEGWESIRTGKTPAGDIIKPDGMGGLFVIDPKDGKITKNDGRGKETVIRPGAGGAQQGAAQDVAVGGKVIGQASTAEEAKALVAQYKKQTAQPAQPTTSTAAAVAQQGIKTSTPRTREQIQKEFNAIDLDKAPYHLHDELKRKKEVLARELWATRDGR